MNKTKTINEYIAAFPKDVKVLLEKVRQTIRKAAPEATEAIKYGIPTFILHENLVHFGGYKSHIGFYPTPNGIKAFQKELSVYEGAKGSVQFPIDKPLPLALITKIVKFRVQQILAKYPISEFPKLSKPAERALANANIKTLKDVSKWTKEDLLTLHGIGPSTIPTLVRALKEKGLQFKK